MDNDTVDNVDNTKNRNRQGSDQDGTTNGVGPSRRRTNRSGRNGTESNRGEGRRLATHSRFSSTGRKHSEPTYTEVTSAANRKATLIGVTVVAVVAVAALVIGLVVYHTKQSTDDGGIAAAYQALQQVQVKPAMATSQGGIKVSVDGAAKRNVPTVESYIDPLCPYCARVDRALSGTWQRLFDAGQINMEIHPLSFLNRLSSDRYSSRAGAALAYVAEHDPKHVLAFLGTLYSERYLPSESDYQPVSDAQIEQEAIASGIDAAVAKRAAAEQYVKWVDASTTYTMLRKELVDPDNGTGGFATPLTRINGHILSTTNRTSGTLSAQFVSSLGLRAQDVGNAKALPSIGSRGKPL